jgi:hypothetical protein
MSLFLRLLGEEDKGAALEAAVRAVAAGEADARVFEVDPESFGQVPGVPFAYWIGDSIRKVFSDLCTFEKEGRYARRGPSTSDDFRYLRLSWEIQSERKDGFGVWRHFAKGGSYSPFFADIHLLVQWEPRRRTFLGFFGRTGRMIERPESVDFFFRPGLTWPIKNRFSFAPKVMPHGCVFSHVGPSAFVDNDAADCLLTLQGVMSSCVFTMLVRVMAGWNFEVGTIQRTPVPDLSVDDSHALARLARRAWSLKRSLDTTTLTSHALSLPALLQVEGADLAARATAWSARVADTERALAAIQSEIDERCFYLYGFDAADRAAALAAQADGPGSMDEDAEDDE